MFQSLTTWLRTWTWKKVGRKTYAAVREAIVMLLLKEMAELKKRVQDDLSKDEIVSKIDEIMSKLQ